MDVGLLLPMTESDGPGAVEWPRVRTLARHAESGGIDSLWVADHLIFRGEGDPDDGPHEAMALLTAVAATTERVTVGSIVFATSFRHPAVFAKAVATLDHVSEGRLILGLGCGWHEPEYAAFGIPFDHRVGRFEESLDVLLPLLRGEHVTVAGRWTRADDAVLIPPPLRPLGAPGALPILIAAKGERMLSLVARHADLWNTAWYGLPDARFAARLADVRAACERAGRDPATLGITVGLTVDASADGSRFGAATPLAGSADDLARGFDAWRDAGAGHVIITALPAAEPTIDLVLAARRLHLGA